MSNTTLRGPLNHLPFFRSRVARWVETVAALATVLAIISSAALYIREFPTRQRAATLEAWGIVVQMENKRASAGRVQALQQLKSDGVDMEGIVLDDAILRNVDLSHIDISYISLRDVACSHCSFSGAKMFKARLEDGRYRNGCNFSEARLDQAVMNGVVLADCNLQGALFHDVEADSRTSYNGAAMTGIDISDSDLHGAIFDNADLSNASMTDDNLDHATFLRATISGWRWVGVSASHADFEASQGDRPVFGQDSTLSSARFDSAVLTGAVFENVDLRGASFFGATLTGVVFKDCDLSGADFTSAKLKGARFEGERCRIDGTVFSQATMDVSTAFHGCQGTPASLP